MLMHLPLKINNTVTLVWRDDEKQQHSVDKQIGEKSSKSALLGALDKLFFPVVALRQSGEIAARSGPWLT